jgi:hypothetical protein
MGDKNCTLWVRCTARPTKYTTLNTRYTVYYIHIIHNLKNLFHFTGSSWFACLVSSWKLLCKSNKCKTRITMSYRLIKISRLGRVHSCVSLPSVTEILDCYVEYNTISVMLCVMCMLLFSHFNQNRYDVTNFSKTFWHRILWKSVRWFPDWYMWGGMQTWNLLSHFCNFLLQRCQNVIKCYQQPMCGICISIVLIYIMFFFFCYKYVNWTRCSVWWQEAD